VKRLLVIRFSALGDVALVVPVLRALAEQYPDLAITMLCQAHMAELFADMPANVTFVGANLKDQCLSEIVRELGSFDAVADLHDVWRSKYIRFRMRLRGARVRSICKNRWARYLLIHTAKHPALPHATTLYSEVFRRLGYPVTLPAPCHTEGQGIGIAPFAAHAGKCYPLDRMERVISLLHEPVVLFGSQQEAELLESWAAKYPHVRCVAGKMGLAQELEQMRSLRVMLTMDSANMHLASLVGTRVVSIWGATHPKAGFLGFGQKEQDCIQRDLPCRPCSIYGKKKCKFGDYRCLAISPEEIVAKLNA
jgi:ADP-heptose:LPS heptosyltransferase